MKCEKCKYFCPLENEPQKGVCNHPERNDKVLVHYYGSHKANDYCVKFDPRETNTRSSNDERVLL